MQDVVSLRWYSDLTGRMGRRPYAKTLTTDETCAGGICCCAAENEALSEVKQLNYIRVQSCGELPEIAGRNEQDRTWVQPLGRLITRPVVGRPVLYKRRPDRYLPILYGRRQSPAGIRTASVTGTSNY